MTKTCRSCGENKPLSEFFRKRTARDGYQYACKPCAREKYNEWHRRTRLRALVVQCGGCGKRIERALSAIGQPQKHCDQQCSRRHHLLKQYGITYADYDAMLAGQAGGCAICGTTDPKGSYGRMFAIDHCHATGKVRGLLCSPCNQSLGLMADKPERLRAAADYLERTVADART